MARSPIAGTPRPRRGRPTVPTVRVEHPHEPVADGRPAPRSTAAEHAFFVEEFRGVTIVIALPLLTDDAVAGLARSIAGFVGGDTRFVLVTRDHDAAQRLAAAVGTATVVDAPSTWSSDELAALWIATTDARVLVVVAAATAVAAARVAAGLGASKLVLTDPEGGWGDPPRSFAELRVHRRALERVLADRHDPLLLEAIETALRGGAFSVNLCRPEDVELELFTFDGAGTLITLAGYLQVTDLRVDDLPAAEELVNRGVEAGILKPRTRQQIAQMMVGGLGARVIRTGHLAGLVGLEVDAYGAVSVGEVSGLITVSEFSGAGAGGLLISALLKRALDRGLGSVFAVTVSDDAAAFFLHRGFTEVSRSEVPPGKWTGYHPERLARARCFTWFL
ncbi:GNAT family N-acetyltransferase [Micropruina sp.]|uniref:GNAT family N-acetyltransferase n=1 Tax=Micropruina sp. TaxID=2737536 RepID=UPI0039E71CDB